MSLRPPSTSPSPSPGPHENGKVSARQSMGPSSRGTPTLAPASPRPGAGGNVRPTSELLGSAGMFQTPEAEALDQWFENLQNYEQTLEDMAAASLDVNFKEELSAIEQWFKVLSEAERTAALYSLLQHSTQVQIRFFITVLQQMARSDPMTALLSPAMGSMQSQMESRLAGMKSPGFKSGLPASPTARNFTNNRQSLTLDNNTNYLSPDSAATQGQGNGGSQNDSAAATLAQQRAKLKASNASHRISAPVLSSPAADGRASWGASTTLSQVSEQASPAQEVPVNTSRPKSTDFSGAIGTPKNTTSSNAAANSTNEATAPPANEWASMVTTPLIPMFKKQEPRPEPVAAKAANNDWQTNPGPGVPRMGDPTIHRKNNKQHNNHNNSNDSGAMYDDNGNPIQGGGGAGGGGRGPGGMRNASGGGQWKSQALNNNQSNRFGNDGSSDTGSNMNGLGMQMGGPPGAPGFGMGPLGSPTMGMPGLGVGMGMQPMSPFNMNMLGMMSPEAQILAAQMAASGFGQPNWMGMQPMSAGIGPGGMLSAGLGSAGLGGMGGPNRKGPQSARSASGGLRSASSVGSHQAPKGEEDVDPALLNDIPAWLRSLRLHKYTPNFEGSKWQDMVMMDEAALEAKGVAALGARRKMLKTFELVRKKMGIEGGPSTPVPNSAAPGGGGATPTSAAPAGAGGA